MSANEQLLIEKKFSLILSYKYLLSILFILLLAVIMHKIEFYFIISLVLIELFYYIHNNIRNNKFNLISFFCLTNLRYSTVVLLFTNDVFWIELIFIINISILRLLEKASEPKYNFFILQYLFKYKHLSRTLYYLLLFIIIIILKINSELTTLSLYFLS